MLLKKSIRIFLPSFYFMFLLLLVGCSSSKSSSTTLGDYHGVSEDLKWETNFKVYKNNGDTILKGEIICLDENLLKKFTEEDLRKNHITVSKKNGLSFGGGFLRGEDSKMTFINYVKNDSSTYNKMTITIGDYNTEFKINKIEFPIQK